MKSKSSPKIFFAALLLPCSLFLGCVAQRDSVSPEPVVPEPVSSAPYENQEKDLPDAILSLNGKELRGWQITDFGGQGGVTVQNGEIKIDMGAELSGFNWTNAAVLPKTNYEIELDAMKVEGSDFFCALTLPVSNSFCSVIIGGWGGGIVGISSINGADASENDTTQNLYFPRNKWYHIRVRVLPEKIMGWIDQDKVIDVEFEGRRLSVRGGDIERSIPLGISTYQTTAVIKNIKLKSL